MDLEKMRANIDEIDGKILDLLSKRAGVAQQIGQYKKENNMTILQPSRWEEIIEKSRVKGSKRDLSERFISKLLKAIHEDWRIFHCSVSSDPYIQKKDLLPKYLLS